MAIYDAITREPVEFPDLEKGYLVDGTIITGYTTEVSPNTITDTRPNGIKNRVPVHEECQWYYPKPEEPETPVKPGGSADAATWDELASAYKEGVTASGE